MWSIMSQLCWLTTLLSLYILEFIDMNFPSKNLHYNTGYYRVDPVFDGNCTILTRYWYAHTATGASAGMSIFVYIWFFVQYTSTHNSHTHFWWAGRKKYIYWIESEILHLGSKNFPINWYCLKIYKRSTVYNWVEYLIKKSGFVGHRSMNAVH